MTTDGKGFGISECQMSEVDDSRIYLIRILLRALGKKILRLKKFID